MPTLFEEIKANGLLPLTLHGVKTVLEKELGVSPILIATDDRIKAEYARRGHTTFPYAHLELNEIMGVRDQTSNRTIQRLGVMAGLNGATKATTRKGYMFPANVSLNLKYATSDPLDLISMAETFTIVSMLGGISFVLKLNDGFEFIVRIEMPEQTSIPIAVSTNNETPEGSELELTLIVHTVVGFFRDVAAVNSDQATTSYEIKDTQYGAVSK